MECRAYGICLDSQSRGYLGKDRKVSSAAGGNLSRMHKTQETAKESRLNFMYSHLRNRTLGRALLRGPRSAPIPSLGAQIAGAWRRDHRCFGGPLLTDLTCARCNRGRIPACLLVSSPLSSVKTTDVTRSRPRPTS